MPESCPVCGEGTREATLAPSIDGARIECPNCGPYEISGTAIETLRRRKDLSEERRARLAHAISKMHLSSAVPQLDTTLIERLVATSELPSFDEQIDNLVRLIGDTTKFPGRKIEVNAFHVRARIGAVDATAAAYALEGCKAMGWTSPADVSKTAVVRLSPEGWRRFDQLRTLAPRYRRAFMAMLYGDTELESLFSTYLRPAVSKTGFQLKKLSEGAPAGLIDNRLRVELRESRFVIADLTHANLGAYWESGFAEGLGRPVIYICRKDIFDSKRTHFDTNHSLTLTWQMSDPKKIADDLKETIRATLPGEAMMTDAIEAAG